MESYSPTGVMHVAGIYSGRSQQETNILLNSESDFLYPVGLFTNESYREINGMKMWAFWLYSETLAALHFFHMDSEAPTFLVSDHCPSSKSMK